MMRRNTPRKLTIRSKFRLRRFQGQTETPPNSAMTCLLIAGAVGAIAFLVGWAWSHEAAYKLGRIDATMETGRAVSEGWAKMEAEHGPARDWWWWCETHNRWDG